MKRAPCFVAIFCSLANFLSCFILRVTSNGFLMTGARGIWICLQALLQSVLDIVIRKLRPSTLKHLASKVFCFVQFHNWHECGKHACFLFLISLRDCFLHLLIVIVSISYLNHITIILPKTFGPHCFCYYVDEWLMDMY